MGTTKDVTELIFRCKDVAMDLVTSVDVGAVTAELQPMLKDGLKNNDLQTIGNTIQGFSAKPESLNHRIGGILSGELEFTEEWRPLLTVVFNYQLSILYLLQLQHLEP